MARVLRRIAHNDSPKRKRGQAVVLPLLALRAIVWPFGRLSRLPPLSGRQADGSQQLSIGAVELDQAAVCRPNGPQRAAAKPLADETAILKKSGTRDQLWT